MKKIAILILVLALVLISVTAYAINIDLKSLSTEELISLRTAIVGELIDRGEMKSATVPAGEYTVGADIPAGSYSISTSAVMATVTVNGYEQMYIVSKDDGVGKMTLKDGDTFKCTSTIELAKFAGLSFG